MINPYLFYVSNTSVDEGEVVDSVTTRNKHMTWLDEYLANHKKVLYKIFIVCLFGEMWQHMLNKGFILVVAWKG